METLMRNRRVYLLLGIIILAVAAVTMSLYSACTVAQPQMNYEDETGLRVQALIDRMIAEETLSLTHEAWSPSMQALAEIGPAAVPKLICTVDRAREIFISRELASGWQPSDFAIRVMPSIIQTRAVMVLGKIADIRALPKLYNLQTQEYLCPLRCEVNEAIKSIKENQETR
jgi:HEAT repeat protein